MLHVNASEILWRAVSESEAHEATQLNQRFLLDELFTSKRHQIVVVDHGKLDSKSDLVLTLFDYDPVVLNNTKLHKERGYVRWTGSLVLGDMFSLESSQDTLTGEILSAEFVAAAIKGLSEITFTRAAWGIRDKPGQSALTPIWEHEADSVVGRNSTIFTTRGNFRVFPVEADFELKPLPNSPQYHLLKEVDPSKIYGGLDSAPDADTDHGARRMSLMEAHRKHLEANGIQPDTETEFEETKRIVSLLKELGVTSFDEETAPHAFKRMKDAGYNPEDLSAKPKAQLEIQQ